MKTTKILLYLSLYAGTWATAHATEAIAGVLETGAPYSALFSASPESGDLIGYAFKNESAAGKTILRNCLPGPVCKIEKSTTRPMDSAPPLKTQNEPSGWIEITMAQNAAMETTVFGHDKTMKTRYGVLSVREDDNTLLFKGKPVSPDIEGNNSLSIVASYELGKNDVFLLESAGGTACPALYRFVRINGSGLHATSEFGTCSDIIYPTSDLKESVTVAVVGFAGSGESAAAQRRAAMTKTVYKYLNGQIWVNGKPLP